MINLIQSNANQIPLKKESAQMCVTSPPYFRLRVYNTGIWINGDPNCSHSPADTPQKRGIATSTLQGGKKTTGHQLEGYGKTCPRCGANRIDNQIGLENTVDSYIKNLVTIFREVWRVLKPDGVVFLNLGDTYSQSKKKSGLNPKNLIGIPWRVALALQADGVQDHKALQIINRVRSEIIDEYEDAPLPDKTIAVLERLNAEYAEIKGKSWWLRSEIIWHKKNQMPESATDRVSRTHETIFMLAKSPHYFFDHEAIKVRSVTQENRPPGIVRDREWGYNSKQSKLRSQRNSFKRSNNKSPASQKPQKRSDRKESQWNTDFRNKRSVWEMTLQPYSGDHPAPFPPELPEVCMKAGSRKGDIVIDPFCGSGTTGIAARKLGRIAILGDISFEYLQESKTRTGITALHEWENGKQDATTDFGPLFTKPKSEQQS